MGLKQAGFSVVGAVEKDPLAAKTYVSNHAEVKVINEDITKVKSSRLLPRKGLTVDLVAGCPPCQGFSRVRRRNRRRPANDNRNCLVDEFERIVAELKPAAVFLENVPGIEKYYRFKQFLAFLRRNGYTVTCKTLDLSGYGVPQYRRRVCVVAGLGFKIDLPMPQDKRPTVSDAIRSLPKPKKARKLLQRTTTEHAPDVLARIKAIPLNGGSRSQLPASFALKCHKKCNGFKDVYGRMHWNKPSPTITGGCINASKGRFLHPQQHRVITLFEAALLQTFPRKYKFHDDRGRYGIAEMIGNALPPEFARRIAEQIMLATKKHRDG